jgi:hypothetical protein
MNRRRCETPVVAFAASRSGGCSPDGGAGCGAACAGGGV